MGIDYQCSANVRPLSSSNYYGKPLVMANIAMVKPWPIEIDDFPSERNLYLFWGFSMAMLSNQRVITICKQIISAIRRAERPYPARFRATLTGRRRLHLADFDSFTAHLAQS